MGLEKRNKINQLKSEVNYSDYILVFLISLSFVLSDWMLSYFSFTELIIGPVIIMVILLRKIFITRDQIKWLIAPIILIVFNTAFQIAFNDEFLLRPALVSIVKLTFYILLVLILLNYFEKYHLEKEFLKMNNIFAMVVCVIAVYIGIAIYLEGAIPWRFFVTFTRTGGNVFRRDPLIVRAKSIFMEPAHLGYYLNTVLAFNLLNKSHIKISGIYSIIIISVIMLTFSYSAIGIMTIILLMFVIKNRNSQDFKLNINKFWILITLIIGMIFLYVFRESIYVTLIERTVRLIQGDESSGYERLILSWQYVNRENFWIGNGLLNTPSIWNNFAYIQSDLGIIATLLMIGCTVYLTIKNTYMGIFFIFMNVVKGGYLSPAYWFLILGVVLYSRVLDNTYSVRKFGKGDYRVK